MTEPTREQIDEVRRVSAELNVDATALEEAARSCDRARRYALGAALILEMAAQEARRAQNLLCELAAEEELGARFEALENVAGLPGARYVLTVEASWLNTVAGVSKELESVTADELLADAGIAV
jgi:hypothetical protein